MEPRVAILSIDTVPVEDILPALMEYVDEESITRISLLGDYSYAEIQQHFSPLDGEEYLLITIQDGSQLAVSKDKVSVAMQRLVQKLDSQGYEVMLLLSMTPLNGIYSENAILLESYRIVPPLIASVVQGHQVGIILPLAELVHFQQQKWQLLESPPLFEITGPKFNTNDSLLDAGRKLMAQGATVIVLDYLDFVQKHRDFLQKNLNIPVLLSNVFMIKIAAELLV